MLRQQCLQAVEPYLRGYIWQTDGFNLEAKPQLKGHNQPGASSSELPTCLHGRATYGDNVEDEWLITWLLLDLTRRFQISARAWDSDGEFLLIEAAYALPKCAPTIGWSLHPVDPFKSMKWVFSKHLNAGIYSQHPIDRALITQHTYCHV